MRRTGLYWGIRRFATMSGVIAVLGIALGLVASLTAVSARQVGRAAIAMDYHDIGGVVTGPGGP